MCIMQWEEDFYETVDYESKVLQIKTSTFLRFQYLILLLT